MIGKYACAERPGNFLDAPRSLDLSSTSSDLNRRVSWSRVKIVPLALLAACGRVGFGPEDAGASDDSIVIDGRPLDDAGLGDPDGYWVWTSGKLVGDPATRQRTDLVGGVRADFWIGGPSIAGRIVVLAGGVPAAFGAAVGTVTTGPRWVVANTEETTVFDVTWTDPDHAILRRDANAAEQTGTQQIDEATIERRAPPPAALAGSWTLTSFEYVDTGGEFQAGQCAPSATGSQIINGTIAITPYAMATIDFEIFDFTGAGCGGVGAPRSSMGFAYIELEGTAATLWVYSDDTPAALTGTMTLGGMVRMVRSGCTASPASACNGMPLVLEMR